MRSEEIKKQREVLYTLIKSAEKRLKVLRDMCKHKNTFEGNYSWRIAAWAPAEICSDCGELIKYKDGLLSKPTFIVNENKTP